LWVPTLDVLNEAVYERNLRDIAVVGTPCVAEGVRTVKASDNERLTPYKAALRLSVAVFCTGVYYPGPVGQFLEDRMGISGPEVKRIYVSPRHKELRALLWDGSERTIPLSKIEGYTRSGCAVCDDLLGESADIAVGRIGAREGCSTLIVRSEVGLQCLHNAVNLGLLMVDPEVDRKALQKAKEDKKRRDRAQEFDDLMLLMLDALKEPRRRVEVREELVRLYELDDVPQSKQEGPSHGQCSQCAGC